MLKQAANGLMYRYEADRVIIRQGHRAQNFYFILSGKGQAYCSWLCEKSGNIGRITVVTL